MSAPRRRLIRPVREPVEQPDRSRQLQKLRDRLDQERAVLSRWQTKLRRSFNTVEKCQKLIARLERKITQLEG